MAEITEELKEAWEKAYSIQSMPEGRTIEFIGAIDKTDYIYEFYKDQTGEYWFETYVRKDGQIITLHEAVHGKVIRRKASHK